MNKISKKKKVFCAMSGGVDSSVAAYLLKKQGFDVVGIFMKNWTKELPDSVGCASEIDYEDARKVAAKLEIPLYTFNFEQEYKKQVVDYMISSYKKGLTPNPDVMCNREIKFKLFLEKALKLGADYIATGHYVSLKQSHQFSTANFQISSELKNQNLKFKLFKAKDKNKDQSYFLWFLGQKQLKYCLFPIGMLKKSEVRNIAKKAKLHNFNKKDSQGLCFLGKFNFQKFLRQLIKSKKGSIIDENGRKIGEHDGAFYFTIGQRHGLNIGGGGPYFVYKLDIKNNIVYVCKGANNDLLFSKELIASDINWITGIEPKFPLKCKAKIRYRTKESTCEVFEIKKGLLKVKFKNPQRAITCGQSVVFYKNNEMLGGGIITKNLDIY